MKKNLSATEKALEKAPDDVKGQLSEFLEGATKECQALEDDCTEIRKLSSEMAMYFCEDPKKFKLKEYLGMLKQFSERIEKAKEVRLLLIHYRYINISYCKG